MPVSRRETPTHAGAMIRYERRKKGLHLADVAQRVGVSTATVSRWERGREPMPFERREEVAEALGIDPARLGDPAPVELTSEDRRVLDGYHGLPPSERAAIRDLLGLRRSTGRGASTRAATAKGRRRSPSIVWRKAGRQALPPSCVLAGESSTRARQSPLPPSAMCEPRCGIECRFEMLPGAFG